MITFVEKQCYDFDYAGLEEEDNGDVFIQLMYDGQRTLPGFGRLEYRVKALPFQITLPPDHFPRKIRCFVNKLIVNKFNPEQEEQFPFLVQDREWLLKQVYVPGFTYRFSVIGMGIVAGQYTLRDIINGIEHPFYESAESLNVGDSFDRVIQSISRINLQLAENRYEALCKAGFKVGRKLQFTIRKQKIDEQGQRFLQLIDKFRGFWHRFYLEEDETLPDQDDIELEIGDITEPGWLCLQYPGTRVADLQKIRLSQNIDFGREDSHREFKTSIAFPPDGKNIANFDAQLRHNIMRVLASFLNSNGGQLFIGVDDSGIVSGIEGDLPWLNQDDKDQFSGQYTNTTDSYELKITNAISKELGELAASLMSTRFFKTDTDKVFCEINVKPASSPIYLHGSLLMVRTGNGCRQLRNGDITSFVLERMRSQHGLPLPPASAPLPSPQVPLKLAEDSSASEVTTPITLTPPDKKPVVNWGILSFFADGTRQFGRACTDSDKVAEVQLSQKHRQSKYRLLQCYAGGNVNVIGELDKKVPATKNKRYKNSWNTDDRLAAVFACHVNDYLVIHSIDNSGAARIKAIQVSEISVHSSLTAQGNALVSPADATVTEYQLVPERYSSFIYDIIAKGRYTGPGENASLIRFQECLAFLEQQKQSNVTTE